MRNIAILIMISIVSCGMPDVTSISLDLNRPFITRLVPGDKQVTVYFSSQNSEPAFSGYNIYFGDNLNPKKYIIYNQQQQIPTISSQRSGNLIDYSYTIKIGDYFSTNNNSKNVHQLENTDIRNGLPMYVFVSSYQITPVAESSYVFDNYVQTATPRPEWLNQNVVNGKSVEIEGIAMADVVNTAGVLYFHNVPSGSMIEVAANSLYDINLAPTNGYQAKNFEIKANRLYQIKLSSSANSSRYGKIYVKQLTPTSATIDYCLQSSENIRSY